jgi:hypothetical protein
VTSEGSAGSGGETHADTECETAAVNNGKWGVASHRSACCGCFALHFLVLEEAVAVLLIALRMPNAPDALKSVKIRAHVHSRLAGDRLPS